jgi:hypothetical protein
LKVIVEGMAKGTERYRANRKRNLKDDTFSQGHAIGPLEKDRQGAVGEEVQAWLVGVPVIPGTTAESDEGTDLMVGIDVKTTHHANGSMLFKDASGSKLSPVGTEPKFLADAAALLIPDAANLAKYKPGDVRRYTDWDLHGILPRYEFLKRAVYRKWGQYYGWGVSQDQLWPFLGPKKHHCPACGYACEG